MKKTRWLVLSFMCVFGIGIALLFCSPAFAVTGVLTGTDSPGQAGFNLMDDINANVRDLDNIVMDYRPSETDLNGIIYNAKKELTVDYQYFVVLNAPDGNTADGWTILNMVAPTGFAAVTIYMSDQPFYLTGDGSDNGYIVLTSDGTVGTVTWNTDNAAFYCRDNTTKTINLARLYSTGQVNDYYNIYCSSQEITRATLYNTTKGASVYKEASATYVYGEIGNFDNSDIGYSSDIPAPQNLMFTATKKGLWGLGGIEHKLTWTNVLVNSLSVRISAVIECGDAYDYSNVRKVQLMVCSDGSDGATSGHPAFSKKYAYDLSSINSKVYALYGETCSWSVVQYRVQFYCYENGKMLVGPVGIINLERNSAGLEIGSTVTTEYPEDEASLGTSGGLLDDEDGSWSSSGQSYDSYDTSGNPIGSGTVGDSSSSSSASTGNVILDFISSFANIPTLLSQFFSSLSEMMAGIGVLPELMASLFSFLPSELIAVIGLGVLLVIVLRIAGR